MDLAEVVYMPCRTVVERYLENLLKVLKYGSSCSVITFSGGNLWRNMRQCILRCLPSVKPSTMCTVNENR